MKKYEVHLSKIYETDVEILAETQEEAEEIAFYKWNSGEIELTDSGIPGDVDITAKQVADEVIENVANESVEA